MTAHLSYKDHLHFNNLWQALLSEVNSSNGEKSKIVADDGAVFVSTNFLRFYSPTMTSLIDSTKSFMNEVPTIIMPGLDKYSIQLLIGLLNRGIVSGWKGGTQEAGVFF